MTAEADCCGYYLPAKDSLQCLEQNQLWREAFYWMTWQIRMLELRDQQLVGTNHYQQIRSTLFMMMSWDENTRTYWCLELYTATDGDLTLSYC